MLEALAALEHRGLQPVEPLRGRFFGVGIEPEGPNPGFAELRVRKVLGWPQRCKLAHAFLRGYSYKRLKLSQFLGQLGVFLTCVTQRIAPSLRRIMLILTERWSSLPWSSSKVSASRP